MMKWQTKESQSSYKSTEKYDDDVDTPNIQLRAKAASRIFQAHMLGMKAVVLKIWQGLKGI